MTPRATQIRKTRGEFSEFHGVAQIDSPICRTRGSGLWRRGPLPCNRHPAHARATPFQWPSGTHCGSRRSSRRRALARLWRAAGTRNFLAIVNDSHHHAAERGCAPHVRSAGSFLESTGGLLLDSAEVGAIKTAEEFGRRLYVEAWRRGWSRSENKVVTGDGAEWIWNLAVQHFPGAVQIVAPPVGSVVIDISLSVSRRPHDPSAPIFMIAGWPSGHGGLSAADTGFSFGSQEKGRRALGG